VANRLTAAIETDPAALAEAAFEYLENTVPGGFTAAPANLDTLIVEAVSEEAAVAADVASDATDAVFRAFGPIAGLPSLEAVGATLVATFTFVGAAPGGGYTLPSNTTIALRDADNTLRAFTLPVDVVALPGATSAGSVMYALEDGSASNGLSGAAELITAPAFVASASVAVASEGGADAENDETYLNRLSETLTLSSPRPILPNDFAVLSRTIPGVYRASAVDGLKPASTSGAIPTPSGAESTGNSRMVTIAVTDVAGADPGGTVRQAVADYLASEREINFVPYVVPALYRAVAVTATVKVWPGVDTVTAAAETEAAIRSFLSPATYAGGPTSDPTVWLNEPLLKLGMLYDVIGDVGSVRYVTALTFGPSGGSMGTADVDIAQGSARPALPTTVAGTTAGTGINVTATA